MSERVTQAQPLFSGLYPGTAGRFYRLALSGSEDPAPSGNPLSTTESTDEALANYRTANEKAHRGRERDSSKEEIGQLELARLQAWSKALSLCAAPSAGSRVEDAKVLLSHLTEMKRAIGSIDRVDPRLVCKIGQEIYFRGVELGFDGPAEALKDVGLRLLQVGSRKSSGDPPHCYAGNGVFLFSSLEEMNKFLRPINGAFGQRFAAGGRTLSMSFLVWWAQTAEMRDFDRGMQTFIRTLIDYGILSRGADGKVQAGAFPSVVFSPRVDEWMGHELTHRYYDGELAPDAAKLASSNARYAAADPATRRKIDGFVDWYRRDAKLVHQDFPEAERQLAVHKFFVLSDVEERFNQLPDRVRKQIWGVLRTNYREFHPEDLLNEVAAFSHQLGTGVSRDRTESSSGPTGPRADFVARMAAGRRMFDDRPVSHQNAIDGRSSAEHARFQSWKAERPNSPLGGHEDLTSTNELRQNVRDNEVVVAIFTDLKNCGPCRQLERRMAEFVGSTSGYKIVSIHPEIGEDVFSAFNVSGLPDIRLFVKGEQVRSIHGVVENKLNQLFAAAEQATPLHRLQWRLELPKEPRQARQGE